MNNKPLVLIVEDEEGICKFISTILIANDFNVMKTAKGKEAISMVASHNPDLILLDLGLPDIDGVEVLKTIRQWSGIPVIVVSARGHEREKVEALDLGADEAICRRSQMANAGGGGYGPPGFRRSGHGRVAR